MVETKAVNCGISAPTARVLSASFRLYGMTTTNISVIKNKPKAHRFKLR